MPVLLDFSQLPGQDPEHACFLSLVVVHGSK